MKKQAEYNWQIEERQAQNKTNTLITLAAIPTVILISTVEMWTNAILSIFGL